MVRLISFLCMLMLSANAWGEMVLVRNGKTKYTIVISLNPKPEEIRAADYLQRYVQQVSGVIMPIVTDNFPASDREIVIGENNRYNSRELFGISQPEGDEFFLKTKENKLFLFGGAKGLFYSVVTILEHYMGCRKFSPDFEFIPKSASITLPEINIHEKPFNSLRVVYGNFTNNKDYKDWNRLNEIDDFFGDGYYSHTFWKLVPSSYFQTNPEFFALVNGQRTPKQLCPSNPEVLNIAIKTLEEETSRQPDRKIWSVSQNDYNLYCHCDECMKIIREEGAPSGPLLRFVNKIAGHFPNLIISTLAYTYSRKPPRVTHPAGNVKIMLCTAGINRNMPIASDTSNVGFINDLKAWHALTENLYLWDYTVNYANNIAPFPNLKTLQANILFFVKNGVREQFQQSNTEAGFEFSELKSYLVSRLLWNPFAQTDSIMVDFFKGYYGKAATYIRNYAYRMERESNKSREVLSNFSSPSWYANTFLSEFNILYYKACFDSAFQAVKTDSAMTAHVAIAYLPLQYAIFEIAKVEPSGQRGWFANQAGGKLVPRINLKNELDRFIQYCRKYRVTKLNEAGLTPDEYVDANKRFLDPQMTRNLAYKKKVVAEPMPREDFSRGNIMLLTNGLYGSSTVNSQWIGWQGTDFTLTLDLEKVEHPSEIGISSLNLPTSWAFYPNRIVCQVSENGKDYQTVGQFEMDNHIKIEEVTHNFSMSIPPGNVRYVRFKVECTKKLPEWIVQDGDPSWTFIDEIVVRP